MYGKIPNIILVILFLFATTGFTFSKHYCGTRLVSVAINNETKSCCDDQKDNCCHDETEYFQLNDYFNTSFTHFNFRNYFIIDLDLFENFLFNIYFREDNTDYFISYTDSSPPLKIKTILAKLKTYLL
jgi:hypothetical protein